MSGSMRGKMLLAAFSVAIFASGKVFAQEAASSPNEPLATAMMNNGWASVGLVDVARDGEKLTVKVRFEAAEGVSGRETVYSGLPEEMWKTDFYIVSGDKKYLIMKDGAEKPLAPSSLVLKADAPQAGAWNATFPAPPAGAQATLHMLDIEPLGPFTVP